MSYINIVREYSSHYSKIKKNSEKETTKKVLNVLNYIIAKLIFPNAWIGVVYITEKINKSFLAYYFGLCSYKIILK